MSELKQWHFFDKVYRRWVVLFVGPTEAFKKELRDGGYKYVDEIEEAMGMCIEMKPDNNDVGNDATIIWLREWHLPTLVHEITHLVMMLFDQCLVPISKDNTEAFAFYTEYWWTEMQRAKRKFPQGNTPKEVKK